MVIIFEVIVVLVVAYIITTALVLLGFKYLLKDTVKDKNDIGASFTPVLNVVILAFMMAHVLNVCSTYCYEIFADFVGLNNKIKYINDKLYNWLNKDIK